MNFIFSRAKTIFYSLAALVRKILICPSKIKFISSRHRVISSISYFIFIQALSSVLSYILSSMPSPEFPIKKSFLT